MDRRRLELMWWGTAAADLSAVVLATTSWVSRADPSWWSIAALGALLVMQVGVALVNRPRPLTATPIRLRDRHLGEASARVTKGSSVEPPELEAEALQLACRNLWAITLQAAYPLLGASFVLQPATGVLGFFPLVGVVFIVGGLVVLGYVRSRIHNLVAVEARRALAPSATT